MELHRHLEETVIDAYIAMCPAAHQPILRRLRAIIRESCPDAQEAILRQTPTFLLDGVFLQFASSGRYIDFFPGPNAIIVFMPRLEGYTFTKNVIQLSPHVPLDEALIADIVRFRLRERCWASAE